jgi:hypothetical protein
MKKLITLFLIILALGMIAVSCQKDDSLTQPTAVQEIDIPAKT